MSGRPWYKRYPADFIFGTLQMDLETKGAYSIVLDLIYDRRGPIPDDAKWIARTCGCSTRKWLAIRTKLLDLEKIHIIGGLISNGRAEKQIENESKEHDKFVESGAKSGRKRAEKFTNRSRKIAEKDGEFNDINDLDEKGLEHRAHVPDAICQMLDIKDVANATPKNNDPDDIRAAVDLWNEFADAEGLPRAQRITAARKSKIKARLNDCGGLDGWKAALEKVRGSPGLLGRVGGNWKASLDFLLQESSFTKLMEGSYDGWTSKNWGSGPSGVIEAGRRAEEIVKRIDPNGIKY